MKVGKVVFLYQANCYQLSNTLYQLYIIRELDLSLKFTIQNGIRGILMLQNTADTYPAKASKKTAILVAES